MTAYDPKLHDDRMALYRRLVDVLRSVTKRRHRDFDAELEAVRQAANAWAQGRPECQTVTVDQVQACDRFAAGHIDWSTKLPLYVSEAVYGLRWER